LTILPPSPWLSSCRQTFWVRKKDRPQIEGDNPFPVLLRGLHEWLGKVGTGVIHQTIDPTKTIDRSRHQLIQSRIVTYVTGDGFCPAEFGRHLCCGGVTDIGDDDTGSLAGADPGDARAQTATASGDDDHLVLQQHRSLLVF
jgi:hypothetical protein